MNKPYIFLADDDEDDRMLFSEALEEQWPEAIIITFDSGIDLMANLLDKEHKLPDVIFLDLNMPLMNGEECLTDIRRVPQLVDIPIIIYSTSLDPGKVNTLRAGGANKFLKKPESFKKLKVSLQNTIQSVLDREIGMDTDFIVNY